VKVTQTIAAHDSNLSHEEFQKLGIPYAFPHLNERHLWLTYVEGQLMADKVICPSKASKRIVESYGVRDAVVIPHGVVPPDGPIPMPNTFHIGYLGQVGPDKGLIYLLEAWTKLNLTGHRLLIAGRDGPQLAPIWNGLGHKGEVEFMGWVEKPSNLFSRCSVLVAPSVTEGFGICVLEAMAHGRPVIVSEGAGAADVVRNCTDGYVVPRRDPDAIADCIQILKNDPALAASMGLNARERAMEYTWDKIIPQYQALWKELIS
jgi:glycosyltransferase involved in cell wall biosynthesis